MTEYDVGVVGGGIAGVAVASAAARRGLSAVLVEREEALSSHSTGRSAASVDPVIGPEAVRALTGASMPYFLDDDGAGGQHSLLTARPVMLTAGADGAARLHETAETVLGWQLEARVLSGPEAVQRCPVLRPGSVEAALWIPDAYDIDPELLFERFLVNARLAGADIRRGHGIESISWRDGRWELGGLEAATVRVVVNAAGAWADQVAAMAGVQPLGLRPLRRTALAVAGPDDCGGWPLVADVDDTYYMKPWGRSQLLLSPADEVLDEPGDARPIELDVARCIEVVNEATTLSIRHVRSAWAGHRTFAEDRLPVVGYAADTEGFFWCAALGGTGIQNSPAIGELAGALLAGDQPPEELAPLAAQLSPHRLLGERR